jgi:dipeptidyl aminopeptidase/acylaminoacyl peptidase
MTQLVRPSLHAVLLNYHPRDDIAVFSANERTGTSLELAKGGNGWPLVKMNTFLSKIAEGERRWIQYRDLEGQDLNGLIIMPANYEAGKRYPLVTWIYPGDILDRSSSLESFTGVNFDSWLNLQLLTARGYAVLWPSMPINPRSAGRLDSYMDLKNGVLPAIDKVIDLGIADPERLAVWGQSAGGYAVYGIVTQTNRFNAAIATAGFADLLSFYGTLSPRYRYEPYPYESMRGEYFFESDVGGALPWKDLGLYLRNSPIFYVERVQTPLMIVQGDLDHTLIQQGEEFFTSLYRQGKRARFVRYWGEGHVLSSPANICDFWSHMYAWIDEYCDILRDNNGNLVFEANRVKSRNGASAMKPEDFIRLNEIELTSHPWVKQ